MLFPYIFPCVILLVAIAAEDNKTVTRKGCASTILPKLKQPRLPIGMPHPTTGKPLEVKVSMQVISSHLDEEKEVLETTFFFRQEWKDPRLAFESKDKDEFRWIADHDSIWTPDLFFVNDRMNDIEHSEKNYAHIKHFPDGRVYKAERRTTVIPCKVNLMTYPFDKQTCKLLIESYKHTIDELIIKWNGSDDKPAVTDRLVTASFITTAEAVQAITQFRDIKFSSARVAFSLSRTPIGVIFRVILPIAVITVCSWASYLLSRDEVGIRISLCMSPIMTYILQINFCVGFFISPSYLTGLDVWAGTSFIAMFVSGVESIFMIYRRGSDEYWARVGYHKSEFKHRVIIALFVTGLDILSILSVFLSRLL